MKSLLSLVLLLSSFSASAYFTDEYFFYRFVHPVKPRKTKTVVIKDTKKPKNETKEEKAEKVEVETNAKPSAKSARKICYGLGYVSASAFTYEVSPDGKLARIVSVDCK